LPFASLGKTDDVVTFTLGPHPADGELLDPRAAWQYWGGIDRRRPIHWRLLLGDAGRAIDVRLEQCEADTPLSCSAPASLLIPVAGLALRWFCVMPGIHS
jgi:hypothetical protein